MTKIGPIQANSRTIHTENMLNQRMGALVAVVLISLQAISAAANSVNVVLSVNGSHEIGDRIPACVTLLVDDLKGKGDLEFKIDENKGVDFSVTDPRGNRLRRLSDKKISVLTGNQWIVSTNRMTKIAEVDLTEIYCAPYVSQTPHDFNATGVYHITCSLNVSVRARNATGVMAQRRISSKEYPLRIFPATSNSLEKSWCVVENCEHSTAKEAISALVKIQSDPKELAHNDMAKLKVMYNKTFPEVKTYILRLIGAKKPTGGIDFVENVLLSEKNPFLRSEAMGALLGYDCEQSRKLLVEEVKSRRERSYRAAIVVLGYLGNEDCVDILKEVVKTDEIDWVRARANESIMQIRARLNHKP